MTMTADETMAPEGLDEPSELEGQRLGQYLLKRHLATGGMAELYIAEQVGPQGFSRELVIKRILPKFAKDPTFSSMFLDEARIASRLTHPNIGQIQELGQEDGTYYIAMEFIDGASLEQLIAEKVKIPHDVVARIVCDVLQALEFAHESRDHEGKPLDIVHRDVTPGNVMVSIDGIVKLVDFGIAKAAERNHKTRTGVVKGKFSYMSPEQIESLNIDCRTDLFALGIVFYELLAGERPFGTELEAVSRILKDDTPDPRDIDPSIPEQFVQVIRRALEKDVAARYPSARTMRLDIETALRQTNSYAGPREIADVVRTLRGLPLSSGDIDIGTADTGLFAVDRSTDNMVLASGSESSVAEESDEAERPQTTATAAALPDETDGRRRTVAAAAAIGAVVFVGVLGAVGLHLSGGEDVDVPDTPTTVVLSAEPMSEPGADPSKLRDEGGREVLIDSVPTTRLYAGGDFVGTTPYYTRLAPGVHQISLELGDERRSTEIAIGSAEFSRIEIEFAQLAAPKNGKERRRKRRSLGSKIRGLLH